MVRMHDRKRRHNDLIFLIEICCCARDERTLVTQDSKQKEHFLDFYFVKDITKHTKSRER